MEVRPDHRTPSSLATSRSDLRAKPPSAARSGSSGAAGKSARTEQDRATVTREKEKPREFMSGLMAGLLENFGHDDGAPRTAASVLSAKGESLGDLAQGAARGLADKFDRAVDKVKEKVSDPQTSVTADAVSRTARGVLHAADAARDLSSSRNRRLQPEHPRSERNGREDSEIKVTSWNLHHGTSQDKDGARPQLREQIDRIKAEKSDVTLLQEVLPWQAQEIVEKTGKIGYYTQTTSRQGNMTLVDPELKVEGDSRVTLNHDVRQGDVAQGARTAWAPGGKEPRSAQALQIRRPDGKGTFTVFNTHLSTGKATPEDRQAEARKFARFVEANVRPGQSAIGGGDLNMGRGSSMLDGLRSGGFRIDSAHIDHLASRDATPAKIEWGDQFRGTSRLSDHPMITGQYDLGRR